MGEYPAQPLIVMDEVPPRRENAKNPFGTNRYSYHKWVLGRQDSNNRSSLAPTLSRYKQLRWRSRKNEKGLFDIWVCYTPNPDGSMDAMLDADIQSWNAREVIGRDRPDTAG